MAPSEVCMKRLFSIALLACAGLSGCVVAPVGPGYGYGRPVVAAPVVVEPVPPPVVVVRPGYGGPGWYGYGGRWRRGY